MCVQIKPVFPWHWEGESRQASLGRIFQTLDITVVLVGDRLEPLSRYRKVRQVKEHLVATDRVELILEEKQGKQKGLGNMRDKGVLVLQLSVLFKGAILQISMAI